MCVCVCVCVCVSTYINIYMSIYLSIYQSIDVCKCLYVYNIYRRLYIFENWAGTTV